MLRAGTARRATYQPPAVLIGKSVVAPYGEAQQCSDAALMHVPHMRGAACNRPDVDLTT
jgi:hypothetical protein